jgi:type IV secretory pathway VirB3-like protein
MMMVVVMMMMMMIMVMMYNLWYLLIPSEVHSRFHEVHHWDSL